MQPQSILLILGHMLLSTAAWADAIGAVDEPVQQAIVLPPDGSVDVPTNARIMVDRYYSLTAILADDEGSSSELQFQQYGFFSPADLAPSTTYTANVASFTDSVDVQFTTGDDPDTMAPAMDAEIEVLEVCSLWSDCPGISPLGVAPQQDVETFLVTVRLPTVNDASPSVFAPYLERPEVDERIRFYQPDQVRHWVLASQNSATEAQIVLMLSGESDTVSLYFRAEDVAGNESDQSNTLQVYLERSAGCTHVGPPPGGSAGSGRGCGALIFVAGCLTLASVRRRRIRCRETAAV